MLTTKTIIGIIAAIVVVGGGVYIVTKPSASAPAAQVATPAADTSAAKPADGKKIPFSELMKQGGSYSCTVNQNVANLESKGTVYMSNGNISGQFSSSIAGMKIGTSFILRDGYSYAWTSLAPTKGYKIAVAKNAEAGNPNAAASGTYSWNAEQIGDYNCVAWTPDQSKFALPSGVVFAEVGQK